MNPSKDKRRKIDLKKVSTKDLLLPEEYQDEAEFMLNEDYKFGGGK